MMAYKVEAGNLSEITQIGFDPWVYDVNKDCLISAAEKDQAVADWQSGKITMSNALAVVNLWEFGTKNPACGAAAGNFTLSIKNAPSGATYWEAFYRSASTLYSASGVLGITETWNCPYVAGATLTIEVFDNAYNTLLLVYNLGPVSEGKNYAYDCSTGKLTLPAGPAGVGIWEWITGHWKWLAGGAGAAAAIGGGIALAKKKK